MNAIEHVVANRQYSSPEPASFFRNFGRSAEELEMRVVYDVRITPQTGTDVIDGKEKTLRCIARLDAPFGPEHDELPARYRKIGQPVIIGGSRKPARICS